MCKTSIENSLSRFSLNVKFRSYSFREDVGSNSHLGKIRSFEHERGNWASYVSIAGRNHKIFL